MWKLFSQPTFNKRDKHLKERKNYDWIIYLKFMFGIWKMRKIFSVNLDIWFFSSQIMNENIYNQGLICLLFIVSQTKEQQSISVRNREGDVMAQTSENSNSKMNKTGV